MEQNIIRNGQVLFSLVERNKRTIVNASLTRTLLSEDAVRFTVRSNSKLDIKINDYTEVFGEIFRINTLPSETKISSNEFEYEIFAQGLMYDLLRCKFFNADGNNFKTEYEFPLIGTIETFLLCVKNNMHRESDKWEVGSFTNGETKTITFGDDNCLSALQKICQEFKTDFWIKYENGKYVIHTGDFGSTVPVKFEYGKGKGLYSIARTNVNDNDIVNRLYVFGGSDNIPNEYRNYSRRLLMPDADYIEDAAMVAEQGLKEGIIEFDDIYPKRTGKITALGDTKFKFVDSTMDFDLNEKEADGVTTKYLIPGTSAKVHFNTGNLAGYEFEIKKGGYDHSTKTFEIIPFKNDQGQEFPDKDKDAFQFSVDDEYVILDIVMPKTYIDNAEALLKQKGLEQFNLAKQAKVSYELTIDPEFMKSLGVNQINIGDYINIVDEDLNIDKVLRINSITRNFIENGTYKEFEYKVTIADDYEVSYSSQFVLDIKEIKNVLNLTNLGKINLSKIGAKTTEELKNVIFDTDNYFDPENIRPFSIETNMLSVGAKSQQISSSCVFEINYNGDPNKIKVNSGQIYSQQVDKLWQTVTSEYLMPDDGFRYVYAKCSKTANTASIEFSTLKIQPESEPNDYYFLLGILHSVVEGVRVLSITTGTTTINGGLVRTGIISSLDGSTYFNLDTGEIKGSITFNVNSPAFQQVLNNIQVGSRNILRHSSFDNTSGYYTFWAYGFNSATISNDNGTIKLVSGENITDEVGLGVQVHNIDFTKLKDKVMTLSFKVKSSVNKTLFPSVFSYQGITQIINTDKKPIGNSWDKLAITFRTLNVDYSDFFFYCFSESGFENGESIWVDEPMLEWGNIASDWSPAPEDIQEDLTIANTNAQNALNSANQAQQDADEANNLLNDISNDNKVTAVEKSQLKTEWDTIQSEKPIVVAQADSYSLSHTEYDTSFEELNLYIDSTGLFNDLSATTDVNGSYLRYVFQNYHTKKVDLLKSISDKAKQLADAAQSVADQASYDAQMAQAGVNNMQISVNDIKTKTDNFLSINGGLLMGNILSVGDNQLNQRAFLSGVTDNGDNSIRIGAGANYANKNDAAFKVLDNGKLIASNADVSGKINATEGNIGGWQINSSSLTSQTGRILFGSVDNFDNLNDGVLLSGNTYPNNPNILNNFRIRSNKTTSNNNIAADISAEGPGANSALRLQASGGAANNALQIASGDILIGSDTGKTVVISYKDSLGNNKILQFSKGILVAHD